jgi:hypothetical protein
MLMKLIIVFTRWATPRQQILFNLFPQFTKAFVLPASSNKIKAKVYLSTFHPRFFISAHSSVAALHSHYNKRRCKVAMILIKSFLLSHSARKNKSTKKFYTFLYNAICLSDSFLLSVSSHVTLKFQGL